MDSSKVPLAMNSQFRFSSVPETENLSQPAVVSESTHERFHSVAVPFCWSTARQTYPSFSRAATAPEAAELNSLMQDILVMVKLITHVLENMKEMQVVIGIKWVMI